MPTLQKDKARDGFYREFFCYWIASGDSHIKALRNFAKLNHLLLKECADYLIADRGLNQQSSSKTQTQN